MGKKLHTNNDSNINNNKLYNRTLHSQSASHKNR